jgi:hypothetical protein
MQVSTDSYEEYHWHTFQEEIHDCIEDSRHMYSDRDIFSTDCCRHVESDLQIEQTIEKKEYVVISCRWVNIVCS